MFSLSSLHPIRSFSHLRWPLPAALVWAAGWTTWVVAGAAALPGFLRFALALTVGTALAWQCAGLWRRGIAAAGFPLSAWALGATNAVPPWIWLLVLLPVLAAYPLRAWRDAPFFPTPDDALAGLDAVVGKPARVLDAGSGLGHGLSALRRLWPHAELLGLEWSGALAALAAWRCRNLNLQIKRADMWAQSWAGHDLVYLFQRPESMSRAFEKAQAELAPGAWLVSLEFAVPDRMEVACLRRAGRRPLWIYRPAGAAYSSTDAASCR